MKSVSWNEVDESAPGEKLGDGNMNKDAKVDKCYASLTFRVDKVEIEQK